MHVGNRVVAMIVLADGSAIVATAMAAGAILLIAFSDVAVLVGRGAATAAGLARDEDEGEMNASVRIRSRTRSPRIVFIDWRVV